MDEQRQDDQLEPTSAPIQNVALMTYRKRWTIETGGGKGSERSVLPAQHDDEVWDVYTYIYIEFRIFLSNYCAIGLVYEYIYIYIYIYMAPYIYIYSHIVSNYYANGPVYEYIYMGPFIYIYIYI